MNIYLLLLIVFWTGCGSLTCYRSYILGKKVNMGDPLIISILIVLMGPLALFAELVISFFEE